MSHKISDDYKKRLKSAKIRKNGLNHRHDLQKWAGIGQDWKKSAEIGQDFQILKFLGRFWPIISNCRGRRTIGGDVGFFLQNELGFFLS